MKIIKLSLALCFIIFLLNSCGRYPCGNASSIIVLINFSDTESDTLILRRYDKDSHFSTLLDSLVIDRLNSNFKRQHDTLIVLHSTNDNFGTITSDYDYEIYFPAINIFYKITNIAEDIRYGTKNGSKVYCLNPIISYTLNGELIRGKENYDMIYLNK